VATQRPLGACLRRHPALVGIISMVAVPRTTALSGWWCFHVARRTGICRNRGRSRRHRDVLGYKPVLSRHRVTVRSNSSINRDPLKRARYLGR